MIAESARRIRRGLPRLFLAVHVVLVARLAFVQLVTGEQLATRCRDQRAVILDQVPVRAPIYDRNMRVLAGEFSSEAVVVFPEAVRAREAVATMVARFTGESRETALSRVGSSAPIYLPVRKLGDKASVSSAARRSSADSAFLRDALGDPGVVVVERPARYPPDGICAHVVGHLDPTGTRGVSGVESLLDRYLRREEAAKIAVFVDAKGRPLRGLGVRKLPADGVAGGVRLTIDRDVQRLVEDVMDSAIERGAVVVMDPRTGDVLAMASRPSFHPDDVGSAVKGKAGPLVNRAIMAYPPGSVLKALVAAAAIESGSASLHDTFHDPGYADVGGALFRCYAHEDGGHGDVSLMDAMAYSCNTAFISIGLRTGARRLVDLAERFGLGATTGIALPGEQAGVLPDAASMSPQDTANLSIGQGRLTVTPLQVATMMSTIANGGVLRRPRIILEVLPASGASSSATADSPDGFVTEPMEPVRILSEDTCRQVALMLEAVTRWGTGTAAWVEAGGSAGKTGSAETAKADGTSLAPSHAWFAGFAPLSEPRLVIVVFVEEGMSGGKAAAPVFAEIARRALEVCRP